MAWISPTGHSDPDSKWVDEAKAYDGAADFAYENILGASWGHFLELTHAAVTCTKVRFNATLCYGYAHKIDIDIYYGSAWHNVYEGIFTQNEWVEKVFTSVEITKVRVRFYFAKPGQFYYSAALREFEFHEGNYPTVETKATTNPDTTTIDANAEITDTGGANPSVRGFKYGLTKEDTYSESENGDFGTGAYSLGLTGLTANTKYWIRAYVTNALATTYGEWIEFYTTASGFIPSGTKLDICSDYDGYAYKVNRGLLDDGETYTAYFVISTDLTNKQGLAFYKRILDLHLYFMSEDSGTATVEVKRDNEASWQSVGSVSLTGTEDIICKHLAPDVRAKVFLFKISASNFFRFLGVLFEYLPEEMR